MWEQVGMFARSLDQNGVPAISDPWPAKDVSWIGLVFNHTADSGRSLMWPLSAAACLLRSSNGFYGSQLFCIVWSNAFRKLRL